jgi:hypothetical protein
VGTDRRCACAVLFHPLERHFAMILTLLGIAESTMYSVSCASIISIKATVQLYKSAVPNQLRYQRNNASPPRGQAIVGRTIHYISAICPGQHIERSLSMFIQRRPPFRQTSHSDKRLARNPTRPVSKQWPILASELGVTVTAAALWEGEWATHYKPCHNPYTPYTTYLR